MKLGKDGVGSGVDEGRVGVGVGMGLWLGQLDKR